MRLLRIAAPAVLATALVAASLTPAQAERSARYDATGDVTVCHGTDRPENCVQDRGRTDGDIKSFVTNHTASDVWIKTSFHDFHDYTSQYRNLAIGIGTNEGLHYGVGVVWYGGRQHATYLGRYRDDTCPGLRVVTDYAIDQAVTVKIPRSCLSNPGWVRTSAGYHRLADALSIHDFANTGYVDGGTDPAAFGPVVRRG